MVMCAGRAFRLAALAMLAGALAACGTVRAQGIPFVPPELHQDVRRLQGDRITFCLWPATSPTAALDRAVAQAVGDILLVEVAFFEYRPGGDLLPDEFLEEVYIQLGARCNAIAGFALVTDSFPEWLVPTRPYLNAGYVAVVREDAPYQRLGDLPARAIVGSQAYTQGDLQLMNYLAAAPEAARWRRFPYVSIELLARHVAAGTLAAGFVWQPSWAAQVAAAADGMTAFRTVPVAPLPLTLTSVGFVLRHDDTFLRNAIDVAIGVLEEDGELGRLAADAGLDHVVR
jgi:hypothetical protein